MRWLRIGAVSLVLALVAAGVLGLGVSLADEASPSTPTALRLSSMPRVNEKGAEVKGQLLILATLTTQDGKPLSDRNVDFYQEIEFFGPRESYIGSATTDSTGVATLLYLPAESGKQSIKARYLGRDGYASTQVSATIDIKDARPALESEPLPLATVARWLPMVLGLLVLAVWAVLLGVLLRSVLGVRAAVSLVDASRQPATRLPAPNPRR